MPQADKTAPQKEKPERHGLAWSYEEEKQLYDAFVAGKTLRHCVKAHQRTEWGIIGCLKKLGLVDEEGNKISPRAGIYAKPGRAETQNEK